MLPSWLHQKLSTPPAAGAGIHAWIFSVARQLHVHMSQESAIAALTAATANAGRRVTAREIRDAVQNSFAVAWRPKPDSASLTNLSSTGGGPTPSAPQSQLSTTYLPGSPANPHRWPAYQPVTRRCRIADSCAEDAIAGLADLFNRSPVHFEKNVNAWLDWLFPNAEWLCLATDHPATARTRQREKWSFGPNDPCALIVPSPMTGPSGRTLDGRQSHRCLANTGPRR